MSGQTRKFYPVRDDSPGFVATRCCDHPSCRGKGEFRAPKSRDALQEYYWFCLDHVREYNRAWDYFAGFQPDEIEAVIRSDTTWQRPTWPLGRSGGGRPHLSSEHIHDLFGFFSDETQHATPERGVRNPAEDAAMRVMNLKAPLTADGLKARYKELCKRHHPDANGGDKASEERFKQIGQAYKTLMESLNP